VQALLAEPRSNDYNYLHQLSCSSRECIVVLQSPSSCRIVICHNEPSQPFTPSFFYLRSQKMPPPPHKFITIMHRLLHIQALPTSSTQEFPHRNHALPYYNQVLPHHNQVLPHHNQVLPHRNQALPTNSTEVCKITTPPLQYLQLPGLVLRKQAASMYQKPSERHRDCRQQRSQSNLPPQLPFKASFRIGSRSHSQAASPWKHPSKP
jgi:hypothetical protein